MRYLADPFDKDLGLENKLWKCQYDRLHHSVDTHLLCVGVLNKLAIEAAADAKLRNVNE